MKSKTKHKKIIDDIINKIDSKVLLPGDQLQSEVVLCEEYQASKMTVHKALSVLVSEGYITRTAGKGTFVNDKIVNKNITLSHIGSFTNDMKSINKEPGAKLIEYKVVRACEIPNISAKLQIEDQDELIHCISRIRTGDGIPIALSYTYIPCKYLPSLNITVLDSSLYEFLRTLYGDEPKAFSYTLDAHLPTEEHMKLLQCDTCALLRASHTTTFNNKDIFEYTETSYVGDRYLFHLNNNV